MGTIVEDKQAAYARGYRAGKLKTAAFCLIMLTTFLSGRYGRDIDFGGNANAAEVVAPAITPVANTATKPPLVAPQVVMVPMPEELDAPPPPPVKCKGKSC